MAFDFDAPADRGGTWSSRWQRYAGTDVIPLWVADTDFRPPPAVLAALSQRIEHGILGYTVPPPELTEAIVARLDRLYRWRIQPEWLVYLPGVVPGLHHAARSLTAAADHVIVPRPVYQHVKKAPEAAPRAFTEVDLVLQKDRWVFDLDSVRRAVRRETRAFFLCNPQNPGGTVFTRDELLALAEATRDAIIVSDEIHCDLILQPGCRHVPIASLSPEVSRRTVTLLSPNKTFNFPGAGCAWAVIEDRDLRRRFSVDVDAHVLPSPTLFGYLAALAAYREGDAWLAEQLDYLRANRDLVRESLALPLASIEATYLAWIDCRGLGLADPHRHFLAHGVALSPGSQFGAPGFVRLNFGTQRHLLRQALERMQEALRSASTPNPRG
ncbi:MAG: MalY/PatB family protein [Clostridia bacterium]